MYQLLGTLENDRHTSNFAQLFPKEALSCGSLLIVMGNSLFMSPIHYAAYHGELDQLQKVVEQGEKRDIINQQDRVWCISPLACFRRLTFINSMGGLRYIGELEKVISKFVNGW